MTQTAPAAPSASKVNCWGRFASGCSICTCNLRKNIVIDAVTKKISVDEAYKICREHGITPTIVNEPYGNTTKPVVEKISLSPETFFGQNFVPYNRGASFTSNPETYNAFEAFVNDCDCKELVIPADDAIIYQNINGIHIPENHKIKGRLPDYTKIEKEEMIEKLNLVLGEDNYLSCNVFIRGFWGKVRSRITVEMACINICIVNDRETTSFNFSFKYPHSTDDAISDLARLQLWCNGTDLIFKRSNHEQAFVLNGFSDKDKIGNLKSFIDDNLNLYHGIQVIESDLCDKFDLNKELTSKEIRNVYMASSSVTPNRVENAGTYPTNMGKMTLKQLEQYINSLNSAVVQITYSDVLPEDCFQLLGKNFVLGIRKIKIIEPYIENIDEAKRASEENRDVILQFASKKDEVIIEYISLPSDRELF